MIQQALALMVGAKLPATAAACCDCNTIANIHLMQATPLIVIHGPHSAAAGGLIATETGWNDTASCQHQHDLFIITQGQQGFGNPYISMTLPAARISDSRLVTRLSSSPRSLAPAMSSPRSSCITRFSFRNAGRGAPSGSTPAISQTRIMHVSTVILAGTHQWPNHMSLTYQHTCLWPCSSPSITNQGPALVKAGTPLQSAGSCLPQRETKGQKP